MGSAALVGGRAQCDLRGLGIHRSLNLFVAVLAVGVERRAVAGRVRAVAAVEAAVRDHDEVGRTRPTHPATYTSTITPRGACVSERALHGESCGIRAAFAVFRAVTSATGCRGEGCSGGTSTVPIGYKLAAILEMLPRWRAGTPTSRRRYGICDRPRCGSSARRKQGISYRCPTSATRCGSTRITLRG